jgi:hypothetical protein
MRGLYRHGRYCRCSVCENGVYESVWDKMYASCIGVRLASKQVHEETKTFFFDETQFNITGLVNFDNGLFRTIVDPALPRKVHLRMIRSNFRRPDHIIEAMTNIKSLHLLILNEFWYSTMKDVSSCTEDRLEPLNRFSEGGFLDLSGTAKSLFGNFSRCVREIRAAWERRQKDFELTCEFVVGIIREPVKDDEAVVSIYTSCSSVASSTIDR